MADKKQHGERNLKLATELFNGGVYFDWVITTAFYSAIHFVEDKILPCKVNGNQCGNIDEVKSSYQMPGRHSSRERLVFDNLTPEIGARYKWLDDKSRFSRYTTYKVNKNEADKSLQYLNYIYKGCYPKE